MFIILFDFIYVGIYCWVTRGDWGTIHIETWTTTQGRETSHSYPSSGSSYLLCIAVAGFSANGPTLLVPPLLLSAQTHRLPQSHPSSNQALIPLLGQWRELWGTSSTSRLEQPHKQERHHTLTQNLKVVGLWVLLLIICSTFTVLSDVGHITHTCTQHI